MRKVIVIIAAVILVLVILGFAAVRLFFPAEKVKGMLTERLGRTLGVSVTLADVRPSFFPLGAQIHGLVVGSPAGPEHPNLVDLEEGEVAVRLLPLLSKRVEVNRIHLRGLDVALIRGEGGKLALPGAKEAAEGEKAPPGEAPAGEAPPERGTSFALLLSSAEVEDARVRYLDLSTGEEYVVDGLRASTSLRLEGGGPLSARGEVEIDKIRGPALAAAGYDDGLGGWKARYDATYDGAAGVADVHELVLSLRDLTVTLEGSLTGLPDAPTGELALATPEIELGELLSLLPSKMAGGAGDFRGSGPLSLDGAVLVAPEAAPTYRIVLTLSGLDVWNERFPEKVEGLRGKVELTEKSVHVEELSAQVGGKPFRLAGSVDSFDDPRFDLELAGEIDLAAAARTGLLPEGVSCAGLIQADLRGKGRASAPKDVEMGGSLILSGIGLSTEEPPIAVTEGKGRVDLSGNEVRLKDFSFGLNGSKTELTATVADPLGEMRSTLSLRTARLDLDRFAPAPEKGAPGGQGSTAPAAPILPPLPPLTVAGKVRADTLVTGGNLLTGAEITLDLVKGRGTVRLNLEKGEFGGVRVRTARSDLRVSETGLEGGLAADSAVAYRVPLTRVQGDLRVLPDGNVHVENVRAQAYRGKVGGSAHVKIEGPGKATYSFDAKAESLQANDFLSNLTPAKNILFGTFQMNSSWKGSGLTEEEVLKNLSADGKMEVAGGELRNLEVLDRVAESLGLNEVKSVAFRKMWSNFSVKEGRVRMDQMEVRSADADWQVSGSVGFEGSLDYDVAVFLSKAVSEKYAKRSDIAGLLMDKDGRIVLDLRVTGSAQNPQIRIDPSKTASRAGLQGVGGILEKLDKDGKVQEALDKIMEGGKEKGAIGELLRGLGGGEKAKKDTAKKDTTR